MDGLPVMLRVRGRRVVIVGGGGVALRRARSLTDAGAVLTVIAPHVIRELRHMPGVTCLHRPFQPGDLRGAMLVVAATDDPAVNHAISAEADAEGVLVNRADEPEAGQVVIPAHGQAGPITICVFTGGISARAGAVIRDHLLTQLDNDWVTLLETVAPYRAALRERVKDDDRRRDALIKLTDPAAMEILKRDGKQGLKAHCESLLEWAATP